jgi:hypothetical protein
MKITQEKLKQIIKEEIADMQAQQEAKLPDDLFAPRNKAETLLDGLSRVTSNIKALIGSIQGDIELGLKSDKEYAPTLKFLQKTLQDGMSAFERANKLEK